MDVPHNRLEALAVVMKLIHPKEFEATAEQFDEKENLIKDIKIAIIPLNQLYAISDGDVEEQYHRTAVIIEHIRFFYQNLWRPWDELAVNDAQFSQEIFVETRLKPRLELSFDIKDKIIPQSIVKRVRNLLAEAWTVKNKIDLINTNGSASFDISIEDNSDFDYINETELIETMRLKIRFEDIERETKLLEDKHLRIIAASLKRSGDSNSFDEDMSNKENKIHLIATSLTLKTMKDISLSLSDIMSETETQVMFHNSLSRALNYVKSGDKVYVMRGLYSCQTLPWIESDIEINGFGGTNEEIILESSDSVRDIFVNCNANKLLFTGLTLRAVSELQCLVMIHSGFVAFTDCVLDGTYQTRNALIALSKAKAEIENCKIINEKGNKIVSRKGSVVINRDEILKNLNSTPVDKTAQMPTPLVVTP